MKDGYWIDTPMDKYKRIESKCSECGWYGISDFDGYVDIFDFNYCPNCGAMMDGDENDNKNESDKGISDNAYLSKRWLETR